MMINFLKITTTLNKLHIVLRSWHWL